MPTHDRFRVMGEISGSFRDIWSVEAKKFSCKTDLHPESETKVDMSSYDKRKLQELITGLIPSEKPEVANRMEAFVHEIRRKILNRHAKSNKQPAWEMPEVLKKRAQFGPN